jgi:hypothetical protein
MKCSNATDKVHKAVHHKYIYLLPLVSALLAIVREIALLPEIPQDFDMPLIAVKELSNISSSSSFIGITTHYGF